MKTGVKVSDAMTHSPIVIRSGTTLRECAKVMEANHVGALIVRDGKHVDGILTEQDIVRKAVAKGRHTDDTAAKEIMEMKVITVGPGRDIYDALVIMRDHNIRHLPVVDGEDMIGLLTIKDVLKIQPDLFDILVEKFELREEERKPVFGEWPEKG